MRLDIQASESEALLAYLQENRIVKKTVERVRAEAAGAGNMNRVLRVSWDGGSVIVKQAHPWVEKFPDISAPISRAKVEADFYRFVSVQPGIGRWMPALIFSDASNSILVLEDCGRTNDFSHIYGKGVINSSDVDNLLHYLVDLHALPMPDPKIFENRDMRALNHQHLFVIPFQKGSVDLAALTPGLERVAAGICDDHRLLQRIGELGELYQQDGSVLVHGDFYPASWLITPRGVKVIDAEFCFAGFAEFDYGVMLAHLILAEQSEPVRQQVWRHVERLGIDQALVAGVAGVEILRRLLGVAQLPLTCDLAVKEELLTLGRGLILGEG